MLSTFKSGEHAAVVTRGFTRWKDGVMFSSPSTVTEYIGEDIQSFQSASQMDNQPNWAQSGSSISSASFLKLNYALWYSEPSLQLRVVLAERFDYQKTVCKNDHR